MNSFSVFVILVLAFFCGDNILNKIGYQHHDFNAPILFRLHPLTYFASYLLIYNILFGKIKLSDLISKMKYETIYLSVCLLIILYLQLTHNLNSISFLLDALYLPVILSILLKYTKKNVLSSYRNLIYLFFFLNATISIIEKVRKVQLIGNESYSSEYFRSSAIFGHPLNNALIMAVLTVVLFFSTKNNWLKISVLLSGILSIFCFGARGALIGVFLSIILNVLFNTIGFGNERINKTKLKNAFIYLAIFGTIIFIIVRFTSFGDRITALSYLDSSAEARMTTIDILHGINSTNLLWGYGSKEVDYFQYTSGVEIIENFWIAWVLKFGLIATILLSTSLIGFLYHTMDRVTKDMKFTFLIVIFFVASTNNSLSTNTLTLTLFALSYYILYDSRIEQDKLA